MVYVRPLTLWVVSLCAEARWFTAWTSVRGPLSLAQAALPQSHREPGGCVHISHY